jgi:hypothetical protein
MRAIVFLLCCGFLLAGCSTHYIPKEMVMEQIKGQEALTIKPTGMYPGLLLLPLIKVTYAGNQIREIYCVNDKGEKVIISVDRNSMLIVHDRQGQTHKFYLDTVYLDNGKIRGLRSRLVGVANEVDFENVETMEVYSEFRRERKAP